MHPEKGLCIFAIQPVNGFGQAFLANNMETQLHFTILNQPTETTCGPTCLHAVYNYYNDKVSLDELIKEIPSLEHGGTLAVFLACHALRRGYKATIYTYNLQVFDPVWFIPDNRVDLREKLIQQANCKGDLKLQISTSGYLEFLSLGGKVKFDDLSPSLIRKYLKKGIPILTGLSATYLHRSAREHQNDNKYDDICGTPSGHFVVLYGYNKEQKTICVAEPLFPNPVAHSQYYDIQIDRVICSILLGILTYDANILIIERPEASHAKSDRGK